MEQIKILFNFLKTFFLCTYTTFKVNIFLLGIASALDIGLSNWSFEFITISL